MVVSVLQMYLAKRYQSFSHIARKRQIIRKGETQSHWPKS
jgi:hypothetical protein